MVTSRNRSAIAIVAAVVVVVVLACALAFVLTSPQDQKAYAAASQLSSQAQVSLQESGTQKASAHKLTVQKAKKKAKKKKKAPTYKIVYRLNGGKLSGAYAKKYQAKKGAALPVPTREGYAFLGWCTKASLSGTPKMALSKSSKGKKVLYAKWKKRFLVAHRGYRKTELDNSISAFRMAAEKGFQWAEADVRFTKDHVPVLNHSANVSVKVTYTDTTTDEEGNEVTERHTEKVSTPISSLTLDELQTLPLSRKKTGLTIDGATKNVLEFSELLDECKQSGLNINMDLKDNTAKHVNYLASFLKQEKMQNRVRWISTNFKTLKRIKKQQKNAKLLYGHSITWDAVDDLRTLRGGGAELMIQPLYTAINERRVSYCREAGVLVATWGLADEVGAAEVDPYACCITVDGLNAEAMPELI